MPDDGLTVERGWFRERGFVIEAMHYEGLFDLSFLRDDERVGVNPTHPGEPGDGIVIQTPDGPLHANLGDWIVRTAPGLSRLPAETFQRIYEPATADESRTERSRPAGAGDPNTKADRAGSPQGGL